MNRVPLIFWGVFLGFVFWMFGSRWIQNRRERHLRPPDGPPSKSGIGPLETGADTGDVGTDSGGGDHS
ncbi:MAG TPA: hypothetical protein VEU30_13905 [Thermoanaerobaculia bacterium]|nr:hypothetical protein [Thermoanaerobaculia bacterium]